MQTVASLVTEGEFRIQPECQQAIVFLVKQHEIIYQKLKFPSVFSVGKRDVAGKGKRPLMAFEMLQKMMQITTDALPAWMKDWWCV